MFEEVYFVPVVAGLLTGLYHVFSGPDHIAAVAPLAVDAPRKAWKTGFRWGLGHALGVLFIGVLSLLFRDLIPLNLISDWSERLIGVFLIAMGFWGIRKALLIHAHEHEHNREKHVHLHVHEKKPEANKHEHARFEHKHSHAAFGIGTIHGLAGSAHFFGVLPAMAFKSATESFIYLAAFGLGTIVAMSLFSAALSNATGRLSLRTVTGYRNLMCGCSTAALAIGVFWLTA